MMKMTTKLCSSSLIIFLLFFLQTCECDPNHDKSCSSSACGAIRNISFPFRLKDDPKHCGYPQYELACLNNVTTIFLKSQKFHVKAINYNNFTIRLADVSINNHTFSLPTYSLYAYNFTYDDLYGTTDLNYYAKYHIYYAKHPNYYAKHPNYYEVAWPINFMSCPHSLNNSSLLTEISERDAFFDASNPSNSKRHSYIKVGHMNASDVREDMCVVDKILLTSWKFKDSNNVSLSEIHQSLLYGFELSWFWYPCAKCKSRTYCYVHEDHTATCSGEPSAAIFLILVLAVVVVLGGISIPAKIIFGLTTLCVFINSYNGVEWYFGLDKLDLLVILGYIGYMCALRLIIVFPCVMGILIYKFRRRHLSTYNAIERFLQSDNQLMPIRYSYSDIKRMTRGFREKLGQGGYGSVYKGKLRSGHDVAVKLLGIRPGGNDQDFMNEIATIGRIHHCNVVKLVGFCAQGSKRALIFDFMSNGSLEKYIFSREKMSSLTWERKYEIAVGVARGIQYLHQGCDIQILHFDIKPHNILLDDKFIPKISDFGLAKFCSTDKKTVSLTAARGTIGYVAPELINRGIGGVSYKADVYSFGMMLMEMVGLNRDSRGNDASSSQYFPCWIYDCFEQGKDIEIGKTDDDENDGTRMIVRKMTIVALWCIQMSPDVRPSMNKVVEMLEADVERLQIPQRSSQPTQDVVNNVDQSWTTTYSTDSTSLLYHHDTTPNVEITIEMT